MDDELRRIDLFARSKPYTLHQIADYHRQVASPLEQGKTVLFDKMDDTDFRAMSRRDVERWCSRDSEIWRRYVLLVSQLLHAEICADQPVSMGQLLHANEAEICECADMNQPELDDLFGVRGRKDRCYLVLHKTPTDVMRLFGMKNSNSKHLVGIADNLLNRRSCKGWGARRHVPSRVKPQFKPRTSSAVSRPKASPRPASPFGICPKVGSFEWTMTGTVTLEVARSCFRPKTSLGPKTVAMARFEELLEAKGTVSIEDMFQGSVAFMHGGHRYVDLKMPCREISMFLFGYYDNHMGEGSRGIRQSANGWLIKRVL
jgi:hypothetical protein